MKTGLGMLRLFGLFEEFFPVLPNCEEIQGLFDGSPECGGEYDIRIVKMIAAELSKLRLYEQEQKKGFKYN